MAFKPTRPQPWESSDRRWRIVLDVSVLKVQKLPKREEKPRRGKRADEAGPKYRITYTPGEYDAALAAGAKLVADGLVSEDRIEWVLDTKEMVRALEEGAFTVVPQEK